MCRFGGIDTLVVGNMAQHPTRTRTHTCYSATLGRLRGLLTSVPHFYAFTSIQERLSTLGSILETEDERSYAAASAQPHLEPIPQTWYPVLCILSLLPFSLSTQ